MRDNKRRERAFEQFKKVAMADQANGAENLALFRLVPQFTSAPQEDTDMLTVCMRYWSRKGDSGALIQFGTELHNWARDNGYHHS